MSAPSAIVDMRLYWEWPRGKPSSAYVHDLRLFSCPDMLEGLTYIR